MGISALLSGVIHSRRSARESARSRELSVFQRWTAIFGEWSFLRRLTKSGAVGASWEPYVGRSDRSSRKPMSAPRCARSERRRAPPRASSPTRRRRRRTARFAPRRESCANASGEILAANELDCAEARAKGLSAALIDRLTLNPARIEAMARGARGGRRPARSGRAGAGDLHPPQRPRHRARGDAARRRRRHLREPAQRDRRRRRAVPQERQRGGAARRLGQSSLVGRHPRLPGRGPEGGRPAGGGDFARALRRARGGRRDAGGPRRRARRHRAARRKEPGRAGSARGARAGVRPSRRRRACLRRSGGRFRQGAEDRRQRQDAAHRRLRRGRDAAGASRRRPVPARPADRRADRGRLRGARRRGGARGRFARDARRREEDWRTEYLDAIIAVARRRQSRRGDRTTSRPTARITPTAS